MAIGRVVLDSGSYLIFIFSLAGRFMLVAGRLTPGSLVANTSQVGKRSNQKPMCPTFSPWLFHNFFFWPSHLFIFLDFSYFSYVTRDVALGPLFLADCLAGWLAG